MKKIFFLFLVLIFTKISAQDTIYKINNEKIVCKITEIGVSEIKYKFNNNPDGPTVIIYKFDVWKIRLQDNTEVVINAPRPKEPANTVQDNNIVASATLSRPPEEKEEPIVKRNMAIKFELLNPILGTLGFDYEVNINKLLSAEAKIGLIGAGIDDPNSSLVKGTSGYYFKIAPKFLFYGMSEKIDKERENSPLQGPYVKLEFIYTDYTKKEDVTTGGTTNYNTYPYTTTGAITNTYTTKTNAYGLGFQFGVQLLMLNRVSFDVYGGAGYAWNSYTTNNPNYISNSGSAFSQLYGTPSFMHSYIYLGLIPVMFSGGLNLGIAF